MYVPTEACNQCQNTLYYLQTYYKTTQLAIFMKRMENWILNCWNMMRRKKGSKRIVSYSSEATIYSQTAFVNSAVSGWCVHARCTMWESGLVWNMGYSMIMECHEDGSICDQIQAGNVSAFSSFHTLRTAAFFPATAPYYPHLFKKK